MISNHLRHLNLSVQHGSPCDELDWAPIHNDTEGRWKVPRSAQELLKMFCIIWPILYGTPNMGYCPNNLDWHPDTDRYPISVKHYTNSWGWCAKKLLVFVRCKCLVVYVLASWHGPQNNTIQGPMDYAILEVQPRLKYKLCEALWPEDPPCFIKVEERDIWGLEKLRLGHGLFSQKYLHLLLF